MKIALYLKYLIRSLLIHDRKSFFRVGYELIYPEYSRQGMTAWQHYVIEGKRKGFDNGNNPSVNVFFREGYELEYPDVRQSGADAWRHYALNGRKEGRDNGLHPDPKMFFAEGYLEMYPDVAGSGIDAWHHYALSGIKEGRDCGLHPRDDIFFAQGYLEMYPDVQKSGLDSWHHYVLHGKKEGRDNGNHPSDDKFFAAGYLAMYPDVAESGMDPWRHYALYGRKEGRDNGMHPDASLFFAEGYSLMYSDVSGSGMDPWHHYALIGKKEGRDNGLHPAPSLFIPELYLALYADLRESQADPWRHYAKYGVKEHRQISAAPFFDEKWYLERYPEVRDDPDVKSGAMTPEGHYFFRGWKLGYDPSLGFDTKHYLEKYRDARELQACPLTHYLSVGRYQNREPYCPHELTEPHTLTSLPEPYESGGEPEERSRADFDRIEDNALLVMLPEHLGDIIACEPVARYLSWKYPERPLYWVVEGKFKDIIRFDPFLSGYIEVNSLRDCIEITRALSGSQKIVSLMFNGRPDYFDRPRYFWHSRDRGIGFSNYYVSDCLLSSMTQAAGLDRLLVAPRFWERPDYAAMSDDEIWERAGVAETVRKVRQENGRCRLVLLHTTSNSPKRNWTAENFSMLTERILSQNPDVAVIEIGMSSVVKSRSRRFRTIEQVRELQLIYQIIRRSSLLVGIDSSFMHMANVSGIQAVCIMGRLGRFNYHCPYSGRYWNGDGISFVRARDGQLSPSVGFDEVMEAVNERLALTKTGRV